MMFRRCVTSSALFAIAGWVFAASTTASAESECTNGIAVPEGGDYSEWPELFRLTSEYPEDPTLSNKDEAAGPVDPTVLLAAGIGYYFLDPEGYDYPDRVAEIPWSPPVNGTNDLFLEELRQEEDYQYADIVVVTSYAEKFYVEHIHAGGDEIRYVIDGTGYFDIRDVNDEWVRMHAKAGDLIVFPTGIEHRFAVDESLYIQAMRLFPGSGEPDWSSVPRSEINGNNTARNEYVETYLCGVDPDHDHNFHESQDVEGSHYSHNKEGSHDSHEEGSSDDALLKDLPSGSSSLFSGVIAIVVSALVTIATSI
jgi:1,2-dihydroxy-3-keto-5-methylthiopentene dioxygenase